MALARGLLSAEHPFMNLTTCFRVLSLQGDKQHQQGTTEMRNLILGAASALALASPAVASDLPVTSYSESYARSYEYRTSPPVVVEELAPVVSETLVVRRPVIVSPPRVVVEDTQSIRHRECMRHLVYMRTRVRVGVADGAIDVTSTVVGKSQS